MLNSLWEKIISILIIAWNHANGVCWIDSQTQTAAITLPDCEVTLYSNERARKIN